MITLDQLGESSILNFHISYIEDNAYFKFGVLGGVPLFLNFPASIILILMFSFSYLCVLFSFICFQFLGFYFLVFYFFYVVFVFG